MHDGVPEAWNLEQYVVAVAAGRDSPDAFS
jgi:hypothetical protein